MNKEKEIEEMSEEIGHALGITYEGERLPFTIHTRNYLAKELVEAGCRKADEVKKETANSMYKYFRELRWHFDDWQWAAIYTACKAHGAEVDE